MSAPEEGEKVRLSISRFGYKITERGQIVKRTPCRLWVQTDSARYIVGRSFGFLDCTVRTAESGEYLGRGDIETL